MGEKSRKQILELLNSRNKRQNYAFASLIQSHVRLQEHADSYQSRNVQLAVDVERLRQENLNLSCKVDSGGGGGTSSEETLALKQKCYNLQEELTELHRSKGGNAQQLVDLNLKLQEKEKEIISKDTKIRELEEKVAQLETQLNRGEQTQQELALTNQVLTDEQQALQLAFTSLEGKFRKQNEEFNELLKRWMTYKARDADKLNAENDQFHQAQHDKVKEQLQEAAREYKEVREPVGPAFCINATVPQRAICTFDAHEGEVNAVRWAPSGRIFATGGADRKLKLWEVISGKCESRGVLTGSNGALMSVEFDYEENVVIAASSDFAYRVWSISNHRLQQTLTGHSGKVLAAKFLGDAHKVASGSHDRTVRIWDLKSQACTKTMFAGSACNDLVTSDGFGTNIISGHFDRKIRFWDTRSESSTKEIALNGRITSLDLSPSNTSLLACTRDDTIKVIDLRMNLVSGTLSADGFHVAVDWTRAVFSPDGRYVIAGSQDGTLYAWNVEKKQIEKVLDKEHGHGIVACSWHPEGNSILSCDRQRKVVLWSDF